MNANIDYIIPFTLENYYFFSNVAHNWYLIPRWIFRIFIYLWTKCYHFLWNCTTVSATWTEPPTPPKYCWSPSAESLSKWNFRIDWHGIMRLYSTWIPSIHRFCSRRSYWWPIQGRHGGAHHKRNYYRRLCSFQRSDSSRSETPKSVRLQIDAHLTGSFLSRPEALGSRGLWSDFGGDRRILTPHNLGGDRLDIVHLNLSKELIGVSLRWWKLGQSVSSFSNERRDLLYSTIEEILRRQRNQGPSTQGVIQWLEVRMAIPDTPSANLKRLGTLSRRR